MQEFDISWVAIFKITGAGLFVYIIFPALLVLRELLLHKALEKWVLTNQLNSMILMCESDRWYLNNKYNKSESITYTNDSDTKKYQIDTKEVSKDEYFNYVKNKSFHLTRFEKVDAKIAMRHNLITWFSRHYKLAGGGNPIPDLRKHYYSVSGDSNDSNA